MIRLRQSGVDEILIKRVRDWYDPGLGVFIQSRTALFSPEMLFTGSTNGVWYDPSDFTTLFQDAAGTLPVTAVAQPVGRILDKSGQGNHAYNPSGNSANFPVLQQDGTGRYYLAFNGTNQWLQTNSINFTSTARMFVCAGVRKLSDAAIGCLFETSTSPSSNNGAFSAFAPIATNGGPYRFYSRGTVAPADGAKVTSGYSAPITNVFTGVSDIGNSTCKIRLNTIEAATDSSNQGTGNYGDYPLYIGARAGTSLWFNGRLYPLVVAGKQASAAEITNTETFINQKTGAY